MALLLWVMARVRSRGSEWLSMCPEDLVICPAPRMSRCPLSCPFENLTRDRRLAHDRGQHTK